MTQNLPPCECHICGQWIDTCEPCGWMDLVEFVGTGKRVAVCIKCCDGFDDKEDE